MKKITAPLASNPIVTELPPQAEPLNQTAVQSSPQVIEPQPKKKTSLLIPLVIVGIMLLGAIGLILTRQKPVSQKPAQEVVILPTPQPLVLSIDNLKQATTVVDGELLIKGQTLPNTTVVIYSDEDETSTESDNEGNFMETVMVGKAGSLVRATAYSESGEEKTVTLIVGTESDVLGKTDSKENKGNNDKTKDIQGKAEGSKSEQNKNETSQTITTTTTKTTATPTPKGKTTKVTDQATIKKAETKEITNFLANKQPAKKVKKIGPEKMLAAMASESSPSAKPNKNSKIQKMVLAEATAGAQLKRHALSGVITNISDGVITLAHQAQTDRIYTIYINSSTAVKMKGLDTATAADLQVGVRIAAMGIPNSQGLLANRIHVIQGKATGLFEKNQVATGSADPSPTATASALPSTKPSPTASGSAEAEE